MLILTEAFAQYFSSSVSPSSNGKQGLTESYTIMNFTCVEITENDVYEIKDEIDNGF